MAKPQQKAGIKRTAPTGPPPSATVFRKSAKRARAEGDKPVPKPSAPSAPVRANDAKGKALTVGSNKASTKGSGASNKGQAAPAKGNPKPAPKPKPSSSSSKSASTSSGPTPAPSVPMTIRQPAPAQRSFRILAGSYERLLYGLLASPQFAESGKLKGIDFETMFLFPAHPSSVTSVAAAGWDSKWLATGAADEQVKVWDLNKKKEVGALVGCQGTITTLSFPIRTYLLTSDSSGLINIYRTRDWALLRTMRGHTGAVNCVAAHPSGRLALSVGKDGMLRMWDLMRGKGAGAIRIEWGGQEEEEEGSDAENKEGKPRRRGRSNRSTVREEPVLVRWDPAGTRFVIMGRTYVQVYATDMTRLHVWNSPANAPRKRPIDVGFFSSAEAEGNGEGKAKPIELLQIGTEDGVVRLLNLPSVKAARKGDQDMVEIARLVGHKNRVKATSFQSILSPEGKTVHVAVTASSDGFLRVFDVSPIVSELGVESSRAKVSEEDGVIEVSPLADFDTEGARITCLSVVGGDGSRRVSGKQAETGTSKGKGKEVKIAAAEPEEGEGEEEGEDEEEQDPMLDSDVDEEDDDDDLEMDPADEEEELNCLEAMIQLAKEKGVDIEALLGGEEGGSDEEDEDDDDEDFSGMDDDDDEEEEEEDEDEEEEA